MSKFNPKKRPALAESGRPLCECGLEASGPWDCKNGKNAGRRFFKCGDPQHDNRVEDSPGCKFFHWEDELLKSISSKPAPKVARVEQKKVYVNEQQGLPEDIHIRTYAIMGRHYARVEQLMTRMVSLLEQIADLTEPDHAASKAKDIEYPATQEVIDQALGSEE